MVSKQTIQQHHRRLSECRLCPEMIPPVIIGQPVASKILLVGQAPGIHEGDIGRPFGWTAGKTLFKWFQSIGVDEERFRQQVYMSAVCRCFPGKNPKGGDRVPNKKEIGVCSQWINNEVAMLEPQLVIPVGKLAISQYLPVSKLVDVIGQSFNQEINGVNTRLIPLPHPSGASTWHQSDPGKSLLQQALKLIEQQAVWSALSKD